MNKDIRWIQRFENYEKALAKFKEAIVLYNDQEICQENVFELMKEGLIQRFEYTQELAWNVMKDYEVYQGETEIHGSRDAIRKALSIGIITDGRWMNTIADRNSTSHNYDEDVTDTIVQNIVKVYFKMFCDFADEMRKLADKECSE